MFCPVCEDRIEGDGYMTVLHCPNSDWEGYAPDANAVFCGCEPVPEDGWPSDEAWFEVR